MNRNVNALMALVCLSMSLVMTGCGKDSSDDITQLGAVTGLAVTAGDSQKQFDVGCARWSGVLQHLLGRDVHRPNFWPCGRL